MALRVFVFTVLMVMAGQLTSPAGAQKYQEREGIASTDFCADQYVLEIMPKSAIAALSPDAHSDYAFHRDRAQNLPRRRPRTEILLSLSPATVVRQWGGDASTMTALERHNIKTVQLDFVSDFTGIRNNLAILGVALDAVNSANAAIETLKTSLASVRSKHDQMPSLRALYVTPGGVTAGKGTLIDAIITAQAARHQQAAWIRPRLIC